MNEKEILKAIVAEEENYQRLCVVADSCYTQSSHGARRMISNSADEAVMRSASQLQELKKLLAQAK